MPPLRTSLNKMTKPRFQILIEAEPQPDDPDGNRRLRMALKRLLRSFGLRCLSVTPATDSTPTTTNRKNDQ